LDQLVWEHGSVHLSYNQNHRKQSCGEVPVPMLGPLVAVLNIFAYRAPPAFHPLVPNLSPSKLKPTDFLSLTGDGEKLLPALCWGGHDNLQKCMAGMAWAIHTPMWFGDKDPGSHQTTDSSESNSLLRREHAAPFCLRDPPASHTSNSSLFLLAGL